MHQSIVMLLLSLWLTAEACVEWVRADMSLTRGEWTWSRHKPSAYEFTIGVSGLDCPRRVTFVVRNGVPSFAATANAHDTRWLERFGTIERDLRRVFRRNAVGVDATYDGALGYPLRATLDPSPRVLDDELFVQIVEFKRLAEQSRQ